MVVLLGYFVLPAGATAAAPVATQEEYVQLCGVCHLENGQGVPGAFPPFDDRLARWVGSEAARRYLVSVVVNGLYGSIEVGGVRYVGAMPGMASQLSTEQVAGLLNFTLVEFAKADSDRLFTPAEVEQIRERAGQAPSRSLRPDD